MYDDFVHVPISTQYWLLGMGRGEKDVVMPFTLLNVMEWQKLGVGLLLSTATP